MCMFNKATQGMSVYAKIAYIILVSTGVLIPLAVGSRFVPFFATYNQFALFKMATLLFLVSSCLIFWALDFLLGSKTLRWHSLMWVVLVYLGANILSYAFSIDRQMSFMGDYNRLNGLIPTIALVILFFLTVQLIRNNAGMQFFMKVFVAASVILAGYGLLQAIGLDPVHFETNAATVRRSSSFFGNSNLYAGYLSFSIFFAAGLLFTEKEIRWRVAYWVALLMNLAVALTSMTRSIWLACVVCIPLFALFMWRQKASITQGDKITMGGGAAAGIVFVLLSFSSKVADLNIAQRLSSMFSVEGSAGTRIEMWKSAVQVTKEYPLFGAGPDTFGLTGMSHLTDRYLSLVGLGEVPTNAHSLPLQLGATVGLVGMLSYYAVVLYAFIISFKFAWQNNGGKQSNAKLLYAAVLTSVVAFTVNCFVSIADIGALPFYWIALAYLVVPQAKEISCKNQLIQIIPLVFALPFAIMCFVVPVKFIAADYYFRIAQDELQASSEQIELFKKAVAFNPYEAVYLTKYLDSVGGSYITRVNSLAAEDLNQFFATVDESYQKHPYQIDLQSVTSYYYTALAMTVQDDEYFTQAIDKNLEILERTPHQLKVLGNLGSLYKATGETQEATKIYNYIKETGPDTTVKQESLALMDSIQLMPK